MDETLLPASAYNLIPLASKQQDYRVPHHELEDLAHLFVAYHIHHHWGIGILHRHIDVPDMHIMMHETRSHHVEECRCRNVRNLEGSQVEPNALYLNDYGKFQAYEYELKRSGRPPIDKRFLCLLQEHLIERSLHKTLAIIARPRPGLEQATETMVQTTHGDIIGTRSVGGDAPRASLDGSTGFITSWTFNSRPSGVEIVAGQICVTLPTGLHEVRNVELDT